MFHHVRIPKWSNDSERLVIGKIIAMALCTSPFSLADVCSYHIGIKWLDVRNIIDEMISAEILTETKDGKYTFASTLERVFFLENNRHKLY
jgi:hypothetical protein